MATRLRRSQQARLNKSIAEGKRIALQKMENGRNETKNGQTEYDNLIAIEGVVEQVPELIDLPQVNWFVKKSNNFGRKSLALDDHNNDLLLAAGTILTTSTTYLSTAIFVEQEETDYVFADGYNTKVSAITEFRNKIARPDIINETIELLRKWGLDTKIIRENLPDIQSPLELFVTAHQAYSAPVNNNNPISTSLIPIRTSIEQTITRLKNLRPNRPNAAGANDLVLIGEQLRSDWLEMSIIENWVTQWNTIHRALSGSKDAVMGRDEWKFLLFDATRFLYSLLSGLDNQKARKVKP